MSKIVIRCIIFLLLLSGNCIAQKKESKKESADTSWNRLFKILVYTRNVKSHDMNLKFLKEGLKFWREFPEDPRRYHWLAATVKVPLYFLDIKSSDSSYKHILGKAYRGNNSYSWPLDRKSLRNWEAIYPELRKEFLAYYARKPKLDVKAGFAGPELDLLRSELASFLALSMNKEYRINGKIDLNKLKELFVATGTYLNKESLEIPTRKQKDVFGLMGHAFLDRYRELGLDISDVQMFFNSIQSCPFPILRDWSLRRSNLLLLTEYPLSLKHISMEKETVDLEKMRGQVVLVDFWSTNCSFCIARMPAIKAVYNKYKNSGFNVISACLANEDEVERIKAIKDKIGANWPTLLIGRVNSRVNKNTLGQQIWKKYGFWGVPQLLLLNKEGKLVMLNDKLRNGDFEPEVKRLLAETNNNN